MVYECQSLIEQLRATKSAIHHRDNIRPFTFPSILSPDLRRSTRATRCLARIIYTLYIFVHRLGRKNIHANIQQEKWKCVWYTETDARCDKLANVVGRTSTVASTVKLG